jgi:hypothetical protein
LFISEIPHRLQTAPHVIGAVHGTRHCRNYRVNQPQVCAAQYLAIPVKVPIKTLDVNRRTRRLKDKKPAFSLGETRVYGLLWTAWNLILAERRGEFSEGNKIVLNQSFTAFPRPKSVYISVHKTVHEHQSYHTFKSPSNSVAAF